MTKLFPLLVGAMEFCAACVYAYTGRPWLAMVWGCYALACVGLAMGSD